MLEIYAQSNIAKKLGHMFNPDVPLKQVLHDYTKTAYENIHPLRRSLKILNIDKNEVVI